MLDWDTIAAECRAAANGAFLATTGGDGRPHLAWVGVGFDDRTMWTATYRSSQKGRNLAANHEVALHWPEDPQRLIFGRARARLVETREEAARLWEQEVLPYPAEQFWSSPEDPELLFVELVPYRISLHRGDPTAPPDVWTPTEAPQRLER